MPDPLQQQQQHTLQSQSPYPALGTLPYLPHLTSPCHLLARLPLSSSFNSQLHQLPQLQTSTIVSSSLLSIVVPPSLLQTLTSACLFTLASCSTRASCLVPSGSHHSTTSIPSSVLPLLALRCHFAGPSLPVRLETHPSFPITSSGTCRELLCITFPRMPHDSQPPPHTTRSWLCPPCLGQSVNLNAICRLGEVREPSIGSERNRK
ncbi:hypothetical protein F5B22DRAFT_33623 [Xylaria bambusicola]|uniref:uncharacterized protein n=1 Tax=Xylaria bambusicola TaxID=326684 RepID=UPI002007A72B|nr:uncharacterized protein F5B22DRAFT_33623 [Xylaria bambusicola]KAI0520997.1 hypothetical protein F5B22DRAFT_33623 [Xylaria bambusicola]